MTTEPEQAVTVSARNCRRVLGLSWRWVLAFARAHGVPIWQLGHKTLLIPVRELLAALAASRTPTGPTYAEELAAMRDDFARELRRS